MAKVTVELPTMLRRFTGDAASVSLDADTLSGALRALVEAHPALSVHLFDERGDIRQHVLCFHNDANARWLDSLEKPLADGDRLTIMQAVSGG